MSSKHTDKEANRAAYSDPDGWLHFLTLLGMSATVTRALLLTAAEKVSSCYLKIRESATVSH
jgi:hypothetical protein